MSAQVVGDSRLGLWEFAQGISVHVNKSYGSNISSTLRPGSVFVGNTVAVDAVFTRGHLNKVLGDFISENFPGYIGVSEYKEGHELFDNSSLIIFDKEKLQEQGEGECEYFDFISISLVRGVFLISPDCSFSSKILKK